jgi:hypothetical protein
MKTNPINNIITGPGTTNKRNVCPTEAGCVQQPFGQSM